MALSQMQLIKSLEETLRWFERERQWGVPPTELAHLVTRIGELFTAINCNGQIAMDPKQAGYDVVSSEGYRYSVSCVLTKKARGEINFTREVLEKVDRVAVLQFNVDEMEIVPLLDVAVEELPEYVTVHEGGKLILPLNSLIKEPKSRSEIAVLREVVYRDYLLRELETGYVEVALYGTPVDRIKPVIQKLAVELGVSLHNGMGSSKNIKMLGALVMNAIEEQEI